MAHGDSALHRGSGQIDASHHKVHVDVGKHLGVGLGALCGECDGATRYCVTTTLQNQNHVVGRAAASASQHRFHGSGGHVGTAVFWLGRIGRAVHGDDMPAAGFCHKAHVGLSACCARPRYCAFH